MAVQQDDKASRGLFGLGAKRTSPATTTDRSVNAGGLRSAAAAAIDPAVSFNLKALAAAAAGLPTGPAAPELGVIDLRSRPARFVDTQSPWFAYWVGQLRCAPRPHRKLWEYAMILQALYEAGVMTADAKMLGFGVGAEPLASYLAGLGMTVVATDLPDAAERDFVLNPAFVPAEAFDARVEVSNLDMRRLDDVTLRGFDACWSCSVLNELASADEAADTAIGAMDVLRPGGVAVHTTDFAFAAGDEGVYSPRGLLTFSRRFFERLAENLNGRGHRVTALDFGLGQHPMDGYVDLEPFEVDGGADWRALLEGPAAPPHLKLRQDGVMKTSFVFVVQARD